VRDLTPLFKAYDVRGVVPDQLDEDVAQAVGAAFARVTGARRVVVGRDMRASSPGLAASFAAGVTGQGVDVVDIGLAATDQLYYASGVLDCPGAMFTASHNPARYNGIKLCRAAAAPVGEDTGLRDVRRAAEAALADGPAPADRPVGRVESRDLLPDYAAHLRGLVTLARPGGPGNPVRVVVDAGNGMAGHTVPAVFAGLPVELVPRYFELDGSFPHHEANPIDPENLRDLQAEVRRLDADLGLAFDGDADRCFVVDERATAVSPSAVTGLIAVRELAREPGAAIVHNLITSRAVPEIVREHGGVPVRTRVGHSFVKAVMAETGAIFGGEHSGHFYFRDFWRADSGMLAALHVLAARLAQDRPLSELLADYVRYVASGEINTALPGGVTDVRRALTAVRAAYAEGRGVDLDDLDGLTISAADWTANLRPSNTEPLLRLNVEAVDEPLMEKVRDEILAIVRSPGGT
jgi:phosphomannomutase